MGAPVGDRLADPARDRGDVPQHLGENVLGNVGVGVFGFLLFLPCFLLSALGMVAGGAVLGACVIIAVVWGVVAVITTSALSGIYQTALYHYAAGRTVPPAFAEADLDHAFPPER